jgi:hypothetical protein
MPEARKPNLDERLTEAFDILGQELMATDVPDRTRANMQRVQDRIKTILHGGDAWPPKSPRRPERA